MITDATEIRELRKSTEDLIAYDHVAVSLSRTEYERSPGGGVRKAGAPTVQDPKDRYFGDVIQDPHVIQTEAGEETVTSKVLIGPYDDDIQEGDEFTVAGHDYKVAEVIPDHTYETRAWVIDRG